MCPWQCEEQRYHHAPTPQKLRACLDGLFSLEKWLVLRQSLNEQTTAGGLAVVCANSLASVAYLLSGFAIRTAVAVVHPTYRYRLTLFYVLISGRCIRYKMMQSFGVSMRPGLYLNRCVPALEGMMSEISCLLKNDACLTLNNAGGDKTIEMLVLTLGESVLEHLRDKGTLCDEAWLLHRLKHRSVGSLDHRLARVDQGKHRVEATHDLESRRQQDPQKEGSRKEKKKKQPRQEKQTYIKEQRQRQRRPRW